MGGWQACKIALDNSPYLVRAASPVTYCALSLLRSLIRFRRCGTQWGFRCMYFGLPNNGAGAKSRDQQQEWARRIANLRRDRGSAGKRPEILGAVARTLGVSPAPPPFTLDDFVSRSGRGRHGLAATLGKGFGSHNKDRIDKYNDKYMEKDKDNDR